MSQEKKDKLAFLGAALSVIPILSYFALFYSYSYELGVALRIGIPFEFVPISFSVASRFFLETSFSLILMFFFLCWAFYYFPKAQVSYLTLGLVTVSWFPIVAQLSSHVPSFIRFAPAVLILLAWVLGYALKRWWVPSQGGRPATIMDSRGQNLGGTISSSLVDRLGFDPLLVITFLFLLIPTSFFVTGAISVSSGPAYLVKTKSNQELVLLRLLGDRIFTERLVGSECLRKATVELTIVELSEIDAIAQCGKP